MDEQEMPLTDKLSLEEWKKWHAYSSGEYQDATDAHRYRGMRLDAYNQGFADAKYAAEFPDTARERITGE